MVQLTWNVMIKLLQKFINNVNKGYNMISITNPEVEMPDEQLAMAWININMRCIEIKASRRK